MASSAGRPNLVRYVHSHDHDKDAQPTTVASTAGQGAAGPRSCSRTLGSGRVFPPHSFLPAIVTLKRGTRQSRQRKKGEERGEEKGQVGAQTTRLRKQMTLPGAGLPLVSRDLRPHPTPDPHRQVLPQRRRGFPASRRYGAAGRLPTPARAVRTLTHTGLCARAFQKASAYRESSNSPHK